MVDLVPMQAGGVNGGHKLAVIELLKALGRLKDYQFIFVFLIRASIIAEVRQFARVQDITICVHEDVAVSLGDMPDVAEFKMLNPPFNLADRLAVDVVYCPFGDVTHAGDNVPTIAFVADLLHRDWPFGLSEQEKQHREKYISRSLLRANRIQCNSRAIMRSIQRHYNVPSERLFYTHLPMHNRFVKIERESDQTTYPFKYFFYPANFWEHKNHEALLLGYYQYLHRSRGERWHLILSGNADFRADYVQRLASSLGIEAYVHFQGYVKEERLHALFLNAGCLVFPSLHEGFGMPVVEAMSFQLPIICSREYSLKEVGGNAFHLINPRRPESIADAMLSVSSNVHYRYDLSVLAANHLRLFSFESEVLKLAKEIHLLAHPQNAFLFPSTALPQRQNLVVSTPQLNKSLELEICFNNEPNNEIMLYLGELPFGSVDTGRVECVFRTRMVPLGKPLSLISGDIRETLEKTINKITFKDQNGTMWVVHHTIA